MTNKSPHPLLEARPGSQAAKKNFASLTLIHLLKSIFYDYFSLAGFKGNRFHYWTYFEANGRKTPKTSLVNLQGPVRLSVEGRKKRKDAPENYAPRHLETSRGPQGHR